MDKLVIIPTYNEKENITAIVSAVLSLIDDFHVLVIDDDSPDGTAMLVEELIGRYPDRLFLERRSGKLGLGTAYLFGFRWALSRTYQFIFEMDADFSHNPLDLVRLYKACQEQGADVAIGSRYVQGGGVINWPANRIALSRGASFYTRAILWMPVKDPTAGFVCYKRAVLEAIDLSMIRFVGYAFQIEMKYASWRLGFVIKEIPILFQDRSLGTSKMNKGIVKEGIFGVIRLRLYSIKTNYRKKRNSSTVA